MHERLAAHELTVSESVIPGPLLIRIPTEATAHLGRLHYFLRQRESCQLRGVENCRKCAHIRPFRENIQRFSTLAAPNLGVPEATC